MNKQSTKLIIIFILLVLVSCFFYFDVSYFLTIEYLKENKDIFSDYFNNNKVKTIIIFFIFYIIMTTISFPGATILTLAGGAIFGFWTGFIIISFASSIGATFSFLLSRYFFRDHIQNKFSEKLSLLNKGIEREGAFYLFSLRLIPIFPFFMINVLMGLTPISIIKYYIISQLGMIFGTLIYVNAGVQLSQVDSISSIMSPGLVSSFVLLGLLPILAKKLNSYIKSICPKQ
jgi:uncharacterized membrane protein YdjX (TVP38/TMEM64 family)